MTTVFKYPLTTSTRHGHNVTDRLTLTLPKAAEIVHVGLDPNGTPCLWAVVDTKVGTEKVTVLTVGTGHPLPDDTDKHLGSFTQGPFVWHVFTAS